MNDAYHMSNQARDGRSRLSAVHHRSGGALIRSIVCVVVILAHTSIAAQSGWQDEQRLTFDDAISYGPPNNAKYIAVDNLARVHVVWADERDKNREIYPGDREITCFDVTVQLHSVDLTDGPARDPRSRVIRGETMVPAVWMSPRVVRDTVVQQNA